MGTFDPSTFLDTTTTEASSTSFAPIPEGDYPAIICQDPEVRQWTSRKDPSKSGLVVDLLWEIEAPSVAADLGRDRLTVKQGVMLDLNDAGQLDTGKGRNIALGRLREAVGLNTPGQPFNFRMLTGKRATVKIAHRVDNDQIFADVKAVAAV